MPNSLKYQIFISSTYKDLLKERSEAIKAIVKKGYIPLGMELFPADNDVMDVIESQILESDYYFLIVGGRYGSIHREKKISYTHVEYNFAVKKGIPIFPFVLENYRDSKDYLKQSQQEKKLLDNFINSLKGHSIGYWKDYKDIRDHITSTVSSNSFKFYNRPGWTKRRIFKYSDEAKRVSFSCFYYSFTKHKTKNFEFSLFIEPTGEIFALEKNLHEGVKKNVTYRGIGEIANGFLYLNLLGNENEKLTLTLVLGAGVGANKIELLETVFGHYTGISSIKAETIIEGEFIGINNKLPNRVKPNRRDRKLFLSRYSMLHRFTGRVYRKNLNTEEDWKNLNCRNIPLKSLLHIVGTYRILIPLKRGDIFLQARLNISNYFEAIYETKNLSSDNELNHQYPEKQYCLIRSSDFDDNTSKINLTFHPPKSVKVIGNAIIDLPKESDITSVIVGSYCHSGRGMRWFNKLQMDENNTKRMKIGTRAGYFLAIYLGNNQNPTEGFDFSEITLKELEEKSETNPYIAKLLRHYKDIKYLF